MKYYILDILVWSFAIYGLVVLLKELVIDFLAYGIRILLWIKNKKRVKY
ncbi:MAG: hypothetical protein IKK43_04055 [Clostridia bacterium]|nr:hypothetical protein [Clostridia bacterium]